MLKQILAEIHLKRAGAEAAYAADFEKALQDEGFCQAEKLKRRLCYEIASCENPAIALRLQNDLDRIQQKQATFLAKNNYLSAPPVDCVLCGDTGYSCGELCRCVKSRLREQLVQRFGMSAQGKAGFEDSDFEIFGDAKDTMRQLYDKLKNGYCAKFPDTKIKNIVLSGTAGTGKTFLASCIASELAQKGVDVLFITAFALNNLFMKVHTSLGERAEGLEPLLDAEFLIVDDLGAENIYKNVTVEYLYCVINERLISQRHTLLTTNLTQSGIMDRYGQRIWSRLNDKRTSLYLSFSHDDLRLKGG